MTSLYELTGEFLQLQEMLETGETDEEMIKDTLESVEYDLEDKAEGYAKIIRNYEGEIDALKAEESRLKHKRTVLDNAIKRLKENLQTSMTVTGKTKFKRGVFSFSIQKNGGALPVIIDKSIDLLPDECVKTTIEPDKKAIAVLLDDPETKEYYSQFAHFGERGESLRIR